MWTADHEFKSAWGFVHINLIIFENHNFILNCIFVHLFSLYVILIHNVIFIIKCLSTSLRNFSSVVSHLKTPYLFFLPGKTHRNEKKFGRGFIKNVTIFSLFGSTQNTLLNFLTLLSMLHICTFMSFAMQNTRRLFSFKSCIQLTS